MDIFNAGTFVNAVPVQATAEVPAVTPTQETFDEARARIPEARPDQS